MRADACRMYFKTRRIRRAKLKVLLFGSKMDWYKKCKAFSAMALKLNFSSIDLS